jgi:hypothetical protein
VIHISDTHKWATRRRKCMFSRVYLVLSLGLSHQWLGQPDFTSGWIDVEEWRICFWCNTWLNTIWKDILK